MTVRDWCSLISGKSGKKKQSAGDGPPRLSPACIPPDVRNAAGGTLRSGACERNGDKTRRVIRLQSHQHRALAVLVGVSDGITHIDRSGDLLAADVEDDVAGFHAVRGGEAIRLHLRHDDSFRAV